MTRWYCLDGQEAGLLQLVIGNGHLRHLWFLGGTLGHSGHLVSLRFCNKESEGSEQSSGEVAFKAGRVVVAPENVMIAWLTVKVLCLG